MTDDLGLVVLGQAAEGGFQLFRPHVVGRRVDQVAGQEDAGKLTLDVRAHRHRAGSSASAAAAFSRLVAVEAIAAEAEAEREAVCRQRRRFDMPVAGRQRARKLAGDVGLLGRIGAEAEQRAAEMAFLSRNEQQRAAFGLVARLFRPIERDRIDRAGFDMGRGDGKDRQASSRPCVLNGVGLSMN